jgi:hypothetical protein
VRRKTADDRRATDAQIHARSSVVVGRSSKEEKALTTKAPRHQGKNNREDGEIREKRFHHEGHKGHEGKKLTTEAQRHGETIREKTHAASAKDTEKRCARNKAGIRL